MLSGQTYITVVVNSVPYVSLSSSKRICTFCPLGVLCVIK